MEQRNESDSKDLVLKINGAFKNFHKVNLRKIIRQAFGDYIETATSVTNNNEQKSSQNKELPLTQKSFKAPKEQTIDEENIRELADLILDQLQFINKS